MKYKIDHDFHIHTFLSCCSDDEGQLPPAILEIAKARGLKQICITDHYWDETVPCNTLVNHWYNHHNTALISEHLPLPKDDKVDFLFGCEGDMDSDNRIGISKEKYDRFGFIIVSTTHFHHMGRTPAWEDMSNAGVAKRWIDRFDAVLNSDLPFHKTGIAHLTCGLINMKSRADLLETLNLIPNDELERLFSKAKDVGIGIELNGDDMKYADDEADTILRFYRIAKNCGCKFYLGSDSHSRDAFVGVDDAFERAIGHLQLEESDKFVIS